MASTQFTFQRLRNRSGRQDRSSIPEESSAVMAQQEASEIYLVCLYKDTNSCVTISSNGSTMNKMATMPIYVKKRLKTILQNQDSFEAESWYIASGTQGLPSFVQTMIPGWPLIFLQHVYPIYAHSWARTDGWTNGRTDGGHSYNSFSASGAGLITYRKYFLLAQRKISLRMLLRRATSKDDVISQTHSMSFKNVKRIQNRK